MNFIIYWMIWKCFVILLKKTIKQGEAAIASNLLSLHDLGVSDRMQGPRRKITVINKEQAR